MRLWRVLATIITAFLFFYLIQTFLPFKLLYVYGVSLFIIGGLLIYTWKKASFHSDVLLTAFLYVLIGFFGILLFGKSGDPVIINSFHL